MKRIFGALIVILLSLFMLTGCEILNSFLSSKTTTSQSEEETDYRELLFLKAQQSGYSGTYEEWLNSIKGAKGDDGVGITSIRKISTEGLIDTYKIFFSDGSYTTFTIVNGETGPKGDTGNGITSISKTNTEGLVDTYTMYFIDGTTSTFTVTNGEQGVQGIQGVKGEDGYTPVITIGENGNWFIDSVDTLKPSNIKGDTGNGISSVEKTGTEGLVDTYTITFTNGTTTTFTINNGAQGEVGPTGKDGVGIVSVEKISTEGLVDTYLIKYSNDNTYSFTITNGAVGEQGPVGKDGVGITSIELTNSEGLVDTYTITYTNGNTYTFTINNGEQGATGQTGNDGVGVLSVEKTGTEGLVDTYTITFTNGTTTTFAINNGSKGDQGIQGIQGESGKSAYEIYVEAHPEYEKSEAEWLDDLVNGRLGTEEKVKYTVTFDSLQGSLVEAQEVEELHNVVKPSNPTKPGYTFMGWYLDDEKWIFSGYIVTKDITLTAKWSPNSYTITFMPNGGTCNVNSLNVVYNESFNLPQASKSGYTFGGWYLNDALYDDTVYSETESIELTAYWKPLYTITFNSNGGNEIEPLEVTGTRTVTELPTPVRDADKFLGWYLNDVLVELPYTYNGNEEQIELKAVWKEVAGDYEFLTNENDTVEITKYNGTDTELTIPSKINNKSVTKLSNNLFKDNTTITKIVLPTTIIEVGDYAFSNMSSLDEVVLNAGITTYGESILLGSTALTKLTVEAKNTMLLSLFDYDESNIPANLYVTLRYTSGYVQANNGIFKNLTSNSSINLVFDDSWTNVSGFYPCHYLRSITLSNTVKNISQSFYGDNLNALYINDLNAYLSIQQNETGITCYTKNLYINGVLVKNLVIPEGVKELPNRAFQGCKSLETITLPNSLERIGACCFSECTNLKYINIPQNVTTIGSYAFESSGIVSMMISGNFVNYNGGRINDCCYKLQKVYYTDSRASWYQNTACYFSDNVNVSFNNSYDDFEYVDDENYKYFKYSNEAYFIECKNKNITVFDGENLNGYQVVLMFDKSLSECSKLESISIPLTSRLYYIFGESYEDVPNTLKNVVVLGGCAYIEDYAFENCSSLISITIPNSVEAIYYGAFRNCSSLISITIPNSITSIGDEAFYNCRNLYEVVNKSSLNITKGSTEYGWVGYYTRNIATSEEDSRMETIDNEFIVYHDDNDIVLLIKYIGKEKEVIVPNIITMIGNYAFNNCMFVTSITIPNSVTTIVNDALNGCSSLRTLKLPFESTRNIGSIFGTTPYEGGVPIKQKTNSSSLTTYYFPNTLNEVIVGGETIGNYAFYNCSNIRVITIQDGVTSIGNYAFYNCSSLTSIIIPQSVTFIGNSAFYGCYRLVEVINKSSLELSIGNTDYGFIASYANQIVDDESKTKLSIVDDEFALYTDNDFIELVGYFGNSVDVTIPNGATSIASNAFYNCSFVTSITIPNSVTSIGEGAFSNIPSLSFNEYDNVYYLGNDINPYLVLFKSKDTNIEIASINDGCRFILQEAFSGCSSLISIIIPNTVTSIGNLAFDGCSSLTSISIPDSVTSIGNQAFSSCSSLTSISIPDSVTSIGDYTFAYCSSLFSVAIPNSVTIIGNGAFSGCSSLISIIIPDSVISIGSAAFSSCSSLKQITLPFVGDKRHSPTDTYQYPLGYIFGTGSWNDGISVYQYYYESSLDSTASNRYRIPSSLKEVTITDSEYISYGAFYNCSSLASIILPNSVTSIGGSAFYYCSSLASITIPNSVTAIGSSAFYGCNKLIEVINKSNLIITKGSSEYGGVACNAKNVVTSESESKMSVLNNDYIVYTDGDDICLVGYTGNGNAIIPNTITTIGEYAFLYCSSLTSVIIQNGVTKIGYGAFYGCSSLTSVSISNSVTSIGDSAFYNCSSLTSIIIPDSVTLIASSTFYGCSNLTFVLIGSNVSNILYNVFENCNRLTKVYYNGSASSWDSINGNGNISAQTKYFYSETEPEEVGNFWHYVDGVVTEW